jgi:hypothetical protein
MRGVWCMVLLAACGSICSAQRTHYLDCSTGRATGNSLSPESAWNSVEQANAYTFQAGDRLLVRRGSRCAGMLAPKGSGTAQAPNLIGAYGKGPLPVIDAETAVAGLRLWNQQYWEIENIEILGGSTYGLHVGADAESIHHIRVRNVVVHGVHGELKSKESGLIVLSPATNSTATINDVLVDGVTVYDTTQWAGIVIEGASYNEQEHQYGENITVRNSIVHDVAGDGILLMSVRNGTIEHNAAWNTGMQESETIGTPNAIWEWMCVDCRVAWNEGFFSDSPGVDGGVFDIDYGNVNNIVEHNFAHDSQGYCAAIFAAEGKSGTSTNSIVRDNTCLHNGRSPRLARRQGAIFVYTWHHGQLDGVRIERNTILWEPPVDAPAIQLKGEFTGSLANQIEENRIVMVAGSALKMQSEVTASENLLCTNRSEDLGPAELKGQRMQQLCPCWTRWLQKVNQDARMPFAVPPEYAKAGKGWRLGVTVLADDAAVESRSHVVLLESMLHQFGSHGLRGVLWVTSELPVGAADRLRADWHLNSAIEVVSAALSVKDANKAAPSEILLLKPDGSLAAHWSAPVDAARVWLELEQQLGTPAGMQPTPRCGTSANDSMSH